MLTTTLLHTCCAPCSVKCIGALKSENIESVLFWYNPNIHPYTEYKNRRETLINFAADNSLKLIDNNEYGLREFIASVHGDIAGRCSFCYRTRLEKTAQYAAANNYPSFSTTLLISPYQNHDLVKETGETLSLKYNIPFLYRDFRPLFREGQAFARENNFYMQKYCGCIFSEEERYLKK